MSFLPWDGTYLGKCEETCILGKLNTHPFKMYCLCISGCITTPTWYPMHQSKDAYPCIIDEIKTVMGLPKIGTHSLHIGNKLYILYNFHGHRPTLVSEVNLDMMTSKMSKQQYNKFKTTMQDAFVFRMIVGLTLNSNSSIALCQDGSPTSYRNKIDIKKDDKSFEITEKCIKEWFVDTIQESVRRLIQPSVRTSLMRVRIQEVVNRIDPEYVWVDSMIVERIIRIK